jgi:large subunit ribosomal protein L9
MEVILLEDLPGLGRPGDLVKVRDGYARNYLLPRGKVVPATPGNRRHFQNLKELHRTRSSLESGAAQSLARRIAELEIIAQLRMSPEGKAFGSITKAKIVQLLAQAGITADHHLIELARPIKEPGEYLIPIRLSPSVVTELRLKVEAVVA